MRLMHVITGLNVGGAETMLARLLESAPLMPDIEADVVSLMTPGAIAPRIVRTGTLVHSLDLKGAGSLLPAAARLARLARDRRPDVVMGWMHHGQLAASMVALAAPNRPAVIWNTRHSLGDLRREKPMTRLILRMQAVLSRMPAAIVYNSRAALGQYRNLGFRDHRARVIPNGFECSRAVSPADGRAAIVARFGVPAAGVLIGMVARNHPMKGANDLVAAFAPVLARQPRAHLLIVGCDMDRPAAEVAAALSRLPRGSWTLAGHRTDVPAWLAGLDLLVMPSRWGEGFPNILGEAMASGVRCVATDVGDAAWVLGATGRVVAPGDRPALSAAILDLLAQSPDDRAAMAQLGRDRIRQKFSLAGVVQLYAGLCREAARSSAGALACSPVHGRRSAA